MRRVVDLLETQEEDRIREAATLLQQQFDPQGAPVHVEFADCEAQGVGGWARANSKRIVICGAAREEYFQYEQSAQLPDYAQDYGVRHLTLVVLHEMGHVLDRRGRLPPEVRAASDDTEEVATEFAHYVLNLSR